MKKKSWFALYLVITLLFITVGVLTGLLLYNNKSEKRTSDGSLRLEDDFYTYVNKETFDRREIPLSMGGWDKFSDIQSDVNDKVYVVIKELIGKNGEEKVKKYYDTLTDMKERNKLGIKPIEKYVDRVKATKTIKELLDLTLEYKNAGVYDFLLKFEITQDFRDSSRMVVMLNADPCFVYNEPSYANILNLSEKYGIEMLEKYGYDEDYATDLMDKMSSFDKDKLCPNTFGILDWQDSKKINEVITRDELKKIYSNVDIDYYLKELGLGDINEFVIVDKQFHINQNKTFTNEYVDILKEEVVSNIISRYNKYLTQDLYDVAEELENSMNGTVGIKSMTEFAFEEVKDNFSNYVAERFVEDYFSEDIKEYIVDMIYDIRDYYIENIKEKDWLSESTKDKAILKLKNLKIRVGYPEEFIDYTGKYEIKNYSEGGNAVLNKITMSKAEWERDLDILYERDTYDGWESIPLLDVNAYYNPHDNSINFPVAISYIVNLDDSFYTNLGKIGMVIAHEMSHAFDANGSLYDEKGNMNNWWSDEDREEYEKRTAKVAKYYYNFSNPYGTQVNGDLTLSENIADLGAVECMTGIAKNKNASEEEIKELFTSFASFWANEYNEALSDKQIVTDTHSPNNVRVNATLSSNDLFYETYDISDGDGMYFPKDERVKIW